MKINYDYLTIAKTLHEIMKIITKATDANDISVHVSVTAATIIRIC